MIAAIEPFADLLIALCNVALTSAVVPLIWMGRMRQPTPYATSVVFAVTLTVLAVALLSVGLVAAFVTDVIAVGLWSVVIGQRAWHQRKSG